MLTPSCPASKALVEWVEHGVADALRRGYLRRLTFGVAADAACSCLLEEYVFHFGYGDDGATPQVVGMQLRCRREAGRGVAGAKLLQATTTAPLTTAAPRRSVRAAPATASTVASVKHQIVTLIRTLVQVCHTLDAVPDDRFLFMKLGLPRRGDPVDYEPPCFRAAAAPSAFFERRRARRRRQPAARGARGLLPAQAVLDRGREKCRRRTTRWCSASSRRSTAPRPPLLLLRWRRRGSGGGGESKKKNGGAGGGGRGNDEENDAAPTGSLFGGGSQPVPEDEAARRKMRRKRTTTTFR